MKKKNLLVAVASLIVGYVLGIVIAVPELDGNLLSGDIGKANRYSQQVVDPEIKALEEKLQNDETFLQGTVSTLIYMNARMEQFATLTDLTVDAAKDVEALKENVATLVGLKELAINAQTECGKAAEAVAAVSKGENANFENAMNRSTLAFLAVGKHIDAAKEFVEATDEVLASATQNRDALYPLAVVRDEWGAFCALEALMNTDKAEMAYWSKAKSMVESLGFQVNANAAASVFNQQNVGNLVALNSFVQGVGNHVVPDMARNGLSAQTTDNLMSMVQSGGLADLSQVIGLQTNNTINVAAQTNLQSQTQSGAMNNTLGSGLHGEIAVGTSIFIANQHLAQAAQICGLAQTMGNVPSLNGVEIHFEIAGFVDFMANAAPSGPLGMAVPALQSNKKLNSQASTQQ